MSILKAPPALALLPKIDPFTIALAIEQLPYFALTMAKNVYASTTRAGHSFGSPLYLNYDVSTPPPHLPCIILFIPNSNTDLVQIDR